MLAALLLPFALTGPSAAAAPTKAIAAVRVAEGAIRIDGRLLEEDWPRAPAITDFTQRDPTEGAPPTAVTEVRFLFDGDALYVGARMEAKGGRVQAPLSRRDEDVQQAEYLFVTLDTYRDRRTAYAFGVTAAGVRLDFYHPRDDFNVYDASWSPVWEAGTTVDGGGWTAEMRIPFSQVRFNAAAEHTWGLNVDRWRPTVNEHVFWSMVPKKETGWVSRFGELTGLRGIRPTRRVELLPYAAAATTVYGAPAAGDPFARSELEPRVGGDVKAGLGPNLTLEATVNPDFGQVEADPAEVNLSAFETFFEEKRPFFVEGAQLLIGRGPSFYYSRRIGAAPRGPASGDFVDYPRATTILGAAKLTGRFASGLSLGSIAAVTGEPLARTFDLGTGAFEDTRVAPRTAYAATRVQQEFGPAGSTVGAILTGVRRDLDPAEPLTDLLPRSAVTGGAETTLRFRGGDYDVRAYAGFSHVSGEAPALERLQRSSARYLQRPDQDYMPLDASRTSLSGWTTGAFATRNAARHWLGQVGAEVESPGLELNDLGSVASVDGRAVSGYLRYRETVPGRVFRGYSLTLSGLSEWNFGGDRQVTQASLTSNLTFRNYLRTLAVVSLRAPALDSRLARGGPTMARGAGSGGFVNLASRSAGRTTWDAGVGFASDEDGTRSIDGGVGLSVRPSPRWQLRANPYAVHGPTALQYVATLPGGPAATFGQRYVFAAVDRTTLTLPLRASYLFSPDLALDVYAEMFAASGRFHDWGELRLQEGLRVYGTDGTTIAAGADGSLLVTDGAGTATIPGRDFRVRSFRGNVVMRWEWRPGSTLFVVWQQDRFGSDALVRPARIGDVLRSPSAPGDHYLIVKVAVYLPLK